MALDTPPTAIDFRLSERHAPRWELAARDAEAERRLIEEARIAPLVARIMAARGFSCPEEARKFLSPALAAIHDPHLLRDMDRAVERIARAIADGERICIYGDYDVDGITATAILKETLEYLGALVETYIPHRIKEGYGLGCGAIDRLAEDGVKLIVTVDNGITALEEVAHAAARGVDVVVTDHHEPGPELPAACAVIDPKRGDCDYPFQDLCGAGVAFKLAHALLKRLAPDADAAREYLKSLLDFAALGTVADVVNLQGENRSIVSHGLDLLRRAERPGVAMLFEVAGSDPESMRAEQLAFTIAPRINAAGRTEHADYALEMLLSRDPQRARELAALLDRFNDDRRRIEADMTQEAFESIDESAETPVIVAEREGWHPGVVGIVASRLLDRYYRPSIVIGIDGEWAKGSARSIRGFDMHAAFEACAEHLDRFGGHTMAAGMRLRTSAIGDFKRAMDAHARDVLRAEHLVRRVRLDAEARAEEITYEAASALARMEPFGEGNPKPLLAIDGFNLVEEPRVLKGKHLKLRLADGGGREVSAIGFGMGDRAGELGRRRRHLRLAATPFINHWKGRGRVELSLRDFTNED